MPDFEPFTGALPRGPLSSPDGNLTMVNMDMHKKDNKIEHRTTNFEYNDLIVRRGQKFKLTITFNRPYSLSTDTVLLEFVMGKNPYCGQGSCITVKLSDCVNPNSCQWLVKITQQQGTAVTVDITPSADCIVGSFRVNVIIVTPLGKNRKETNENIYILFNAWCSDDDVFLDNDSQRKEYVLNNQGTLYSGSTSSVSSRPWNFGQFKHGVLEACFYILTKSGIPLDGRNNVVTVCRRASQIVNAPDDSGVLVGRWDGFYDDGTPPTSWTGSAEILLMYYYSGGTPVRYAQCWVYAGVLNSFCRCLGIPARVITNYNSAHDNNGNLKTEIFLNEDWSMHSRSRDSVWNYHCWNEVYMRRPNLPKEYEGWQVLDATPQETSDGFYRCGPTSVKAIKKGDLCYPFDGPFVFAEVNSDLVIHLVDSATGLSEIVNVNTSYVGTKILTKAVDSSKSEDITHTYKHPEGSPADAETMKQATSFGCERYRAPLQPTDVEIELVAPAVQLGQDADMSIEVKNTCEDQRTVQLTVSCSVAYYTGVSYDTLKVEEKTVSLRPFTTEKVNMKILANEYMNHMVDHGCLKFSCVGKVQENNQVLAAGQVLRLEVPILNLKLGGEVRVGHEMSVILKFTNIFSTVLRDVYLRLEGPGDMGFKRKKYEFIAPGASLTWTESFVPVMPGPGRVVGSLDCAVLREVYGELEFYAQP